MLVEEASAPRANHKEEMKLVSHIVNSPLQDLKDGNQQKEIDKCKKKAGGQRLKFDNPIEKLFRRKIFIDFDKEMKDLERERRLDSQRRKELAWKGKRETYILKKWIKEMVVEDLIGQSVEFGRKNKI